MAKRAKKKPRLTDKAQIDLAQFALICRRLQYLCDLCFHGRVIDFAAALAIERRYLSRILLGHRPPTLAVILRAANELGVRTDWLLFGDGQPYARPYKLYPIEFETPEAECIQSVHRVFDTLIQPVYPARIEMPEPFDTDTHVSNISDDHVALAKRIHAARMCERPVLMFLGQYAAMAGAGISMRECVKRKYLTAVAATELAMQIDIALTQPDVFPDTGRIARLAGQHRIGYGEAVGKWAFTKQDLRKRSLFYAAHVNDIPATVHVSIGETTTHLQPNRQGLAAAAALGVAAYIDLLLFAEQVKDLRGGVFLIFGEEQRAIGLLEQTLAAVTNGPGEFAVGLIGPRSSGDINFRVAKLGGECFALQDYYSPAVNGLIRACDEVYSGRILNERLGTLSKT